MLSISLVIPVYNEEERIKKTFAALKKLQLPRGLRLHQVIFVDDGSTDRTVESIKRRNIIHNTYYKIQVVSYKQNKGKGYAVKKGMEVSTSDYTLFFDADVSTPLTEIKKFAPFMEKGIDVLIGTRKNGKSTVIVPQPIYRQLLGRGFTFLSNIVLGTNYNDFTCGFKAFSKKAREQIFNKTRIERWGYDAEVLFLTHKLNLTYKEIPVFWKDEKGSKVNVLLDLPRTLWELMRIRISEIKEFKVQNCNLKLKIIEIPK